MKNNFKKSNEVQKLTSPSIKIANFVFILGISFSFLIVLYAFYKIVYYPSLSSISYGGWLTEDVLSSSFLLNEIPKVYYLFLAVGIFAVFFFGVGLKKFENELKVNISLLFITVGILVYSFEAYFLQGKSTKDTRSQLEVLKNLNDSGIKAYPNVFPHLFIKSNGLINPNVNIYPLGGISNITTILENELDQTILNFVLIRNIRSRISFFKKSVQESESLSLTTFKSILRKSNEMVLDWGGKIYFVYLPEFAMYSKSQSNVNRQIVLDAIRGLKIPIIDIHNEVFDNHSDPISLFPSRKGNGHYNAEGYRLVGKSISKIIKANN